MTTKKKVTKVEIKEIKTKLKGNISLTEARQIVWDDIIHEVCYKWESVHIISQKKIMMNGCKSSIDACNTNVQK